LPSTLTRARDYWRLGPVNLLRVAAYRALLNAGWYRRRLPLEAPIAEPMLDWSVRSARPTFPVTAEPAAWDALADRVRGGELPIFSARWVKAGFPPRWGRNLITQVDTEQSFVHWTTLPDFTLRGGDVKGWWESARFDGLLILVLGWLCTRRDELAHAVDAWWASWNTNNPGNAGLHWKCGQETGLRLMHGLLAAHLLRRWGDVTTTPAFDTWVAQHAQRIVPTMLYAVGQDNNHGTSEAAALYVAGSFLVRRGGAYVSDGARWRELGQRWLEDRVRRLVMDDGSFSQHSVTYHRVMLDTYAFAETWRRWHDEVPFSNSLVERCGAATRWLAAFTDPLSGDAPNLGANDGARLFPLLREPYRDFRPSARWAARLFLDSLAESADERLGWLGLDTETRRTDALPAPAVQLWPDGGYAKLRAGDAWALLRLPRYGFRPSHADALHLDLWAGGRNLLRDGGSYSYNTDEALMHYFSGTASHNTIQFDSRDQMPRLSRFMFGDWLTCKELHADPETATVVAMYIDALGASHRRTVTLRDGGCTVVDTVNGFRERAVLRWRIAPSGHTAICKGTEWIAGDLRISVRSTAVVTRVACVNGWESRHYSELATLPVFEVEVRSAATLTTEISWQS
jgi:Heparinase II/III-like protein/Heparinase II/III N-terminus